MACVVCGQAIEQPTRGRPRLTCSDICRDTKWRRSRGVQPQERRAPHGGAGTRYEQGCRCAECRAAMAARKKRLLGRTPPTHGPSGYNNYGCRCEVCYAAKQAENAKYRTRRSTANDDSGASS